MKNDKLETVIAQFAASIRLKEILKENFAPQIIQLAEILSDCLKNKGKILVFGNGGSAADAQHFACELVVSLNKDFPRPALPVIALSVNTSVLTASGNDLGFEEVFARQVEALGQEADVALALSTSGNSENLISAFKTARRMKLKTVALLGKDGGKLARFSDFALIVPSSDTQRIQEAHITILHIVCALLEKSLFLTYSEREASQRLQE